MPDKNAERPVYVIGHRNPDTDSICSALAYAWLKNQRGDARYEALRAGALNRETEFVLQHLGVAAPELCTDISPQIKDIAYRRQAGIDPEMSVRAAWNLMQEVEITTLGIVDGEDRLLGIIALQDIANANMNLLDANVLAAANTSYSNVLSTLGGELLVGDKNDRVKGQIHIGTSPEAMEGVIRPGDLVLLSNRYEVQLCAIESGAACIIVCCGSAVPATILSYARDKGCAVMTTQFDTYAAARLISTATPVRHLMKSKDLLRFSLDTPLDEVRKVMATVRHPYFPVLDGKGKYCGFISRRNILNLTPKKVILVDHNETTQAVEGIEQADILEIIDHHRLGVLETNGPVYFRNVPVGCTATILYQMFGEQGVTPDRRIAGLMLSAILSDTLKFRSPTCTAADQAAARELAKLAELDIDTYAEQMFEAGGDLTGRTAAEVFQSDFKVFRFGDTRFGVAQVCFMTEKSHQAAVELLEPYLPEAAADLNLPMVFCILTNTPQESSRVLYYGKRTGELLEKAFGVAPQDGKVILPGVVSRKLQFIPPLRAAIQNEAKA